MNETSSGNSRAATRILSAAELTEIWQRIIHRMPIRPDENFFDLGSTDHQADEIFLEISRTLGRPIPTATICYAPSIAELAAILQLPELPRFPPLVHLKEGSKNPPIIIAHGVGGRASFSELAKYIQTDNPIYGLQAKGVDGREEPIRRIEDMAEYYLNALSEIQPQGPYILIGYSFGGLIALEMAQRLSASGRRVALFAMVDSYPNRQFMPFDQRVLHDVKRIEGHLSDLRKMPTRDAIGWIFRAVKNKLPLPRKTNDSVSGKPEPRITFAENMKYVKRVDFAALKVYRPRFYRGKIRFVKPAVSSYLPNDPAKLWKHLAEEFEIDTVPGDHLGIIGKRFKDLAVVLTRYIQEVSAEQD